MREFKERASQSRLRQIRSDNEFGAGKPSATHSALAGFIREMAIDGQVKRSMVERLWDLVRETMNNFGLPMNGGVGKHAPPRYGTHWALKKDGSALRTADPTKKFGLVMQGGGALGAYGVGAIEYLYESGMECTIVSGASSGAMNAVTLAGAKGYPPAVLRALWETLIVDSPPLFMPLPFIPSGSWAMFGNPSMYMPRIDFWNLPSWTNLCETAPLKKTLLKLLDWDQIRNSDHMRVVVSASGVETGETAYFSNFDREPFGIEHVMASASLPPGFPWTMVNGRAYWDGGLTDNTPLKPVIDNLHGDEPATMPIFVINVFSSSAPLPTNLGQVVDRMFELIFQNNMKADSENAQTYARFIRILRKVENQLPADAGVRMDKDWETVMNYALLREIRIIDIKRPEKDSSSDFSRQTILRRISEGYEATKRSLEGIALNPVLSDQQSPPGCRDRRTIAAARDLPKPAQLLNPYR